MTKIKRDFKSRMFTMIFSDKKALLELYNAVANRNYSDPELLTINTLENAIYMSMQNDLSFIIDLRLSLYEQQSTYNPNMPLRFLMYLADLYSKHVAVQNLYGTRLIQIPPPQFIVFYNGTDKRPEHEILKLSDAYLLKDVDVSLELIAQVLNINVGYNEDLKNACKTLCDYSKYVQRVRDHKAMGITIDEAVELTIEECIRDNILREFLVQNRSEAKAVSIYEYNEEEHMRMEREQHYAEGHSKGLEEGLSKGLEKGQFQEFQSTVIKMSKIGMTPEVIAEILEKETEEILEIIHSLL